MAREGGAAVLLAAARASDGPTTTAPAEGPRRRSSGLSQATEWRGPAPRVQMFQRPLCYPATRRTAGRGRRTNVAFHQSSQSAGSPTIRRSTILPPLITQMFKPPRTLSQAACGTIKTTFIGN